MLLIVLVPWHFLSLHKCWPHLLHWVFLLVLYFGLEDVVHDLEVLADSLFSGDSFGDDLILVDIEVLAELREVFVDSEEELELLAFLDSWNESQILEVLLKDLPSVLNHGGGATTAPVGFAPLVAEFSDAFLGELETRLRELDVRVLVNQLLVQVAERLVLLVHHPRLVVEVYLHHVLSVRSVVHWVFLYQGLLDADAHGNLEEV